MMTAMRDGSGGSMLNIRTPSAMTRVATPWARTRMPRVKVTNSMRLVMPSIFTESSGFKWAILGTCSLTYTGPRVVCDGHLLRSGKPVANV